MNRIEVKRISKMKSRMIKAQRKGRVRPVSPRGRWAIECDSFAS